jgi:hypothetical protein
LILCGRPSPYRHQADTRRLANPRSTTVEAIRRLVELKLNAKSGKT